MSETPTAPVLDPASEAILRDCLEAFPHVRLTVTGDCMSPAMPAGETVVVCRPSLRGARWGDVLLVRHAEGLRLHRLVWPLPFAPGRWRTKADGRLALDPPLDREDVLGIVVRVEGAGRPRSWQAALLSLSGMVAARVRQLFR